jgi:Mn2+/Fe2+ NRAMP family transporter
MRLDNAVGYMMTGIFVVAMLVVGAEILLGQDLTTSDTGLLTLGSALAERHGEWARVLFLVGFLAVTTTSLLGVWNGVSLLFADWTRTIALRHGGELDRADAGLESGTAARSPWFHGYLIWLTFPPMALLFIDRPFALTLVYGVLGAAFMPFLGVTLLLLLNSRRCAAAHRSGWLSNTTLVVASLLFVVLLVNELTERLQ